MSKYIYTTIYEQFTGLKPPEPKNQKPRRRRGYGHPYRMRLNMQEDDQPQTELLEDPQVQAEPAVAPAPFLKPPVSNPPVRNNRPGRTPGQSVRSRRTGTGNNANFQNHTRALMPEELTPTKSAAEPKVTYKKRRHYSQPVMSAVPLGGDRKDHKDY